MYLCVCFTVKTSWLTLNDLIKRYGLARSSLDCEVNSEQMLEVSEWLENWKKFARAAGVSEPRIVEIERSENEESDRRYKALYLWHQKNAFLATNTELLRILLRIDRADIAEKVCLLLKKENRSSATGKLMEMYFNFVQLCILSKFNNYTVCLYGLVRK